MGTFDHLPEKAQETAEQFCSLYFPKRKICDVGDLCWWLFKKKQTQSKKLPPSKDALQQAVHIIRL